MLRYLYEKPPHNNRNGEQVATHHTSHEDLIVACVSLAVPSDNLVAPILALAGPVAHQRRFDALPPVAAPERAARVNRRRGRGRGRDPGLHDATVVGYLHPPVIRTPLFSTSIISTSIIHLLVCTPVAILYGMCMGEHTHEAKVRHKNEDMGRKFKIMSKASHLVAAVAARGPTVAHIGVRDALGPIAALPLRVACAPAARACAAAAGLCSTQRGAW